MKALQYENAGSFAWTNSTIKKALHFDVRVMIYCTEAHSKKKVEDSSNRGSKSATMRSIVKRLNEKIVQGIQRSRLSCLVPKIERDNPLDMEAGMDHLRQCFKDKRIVN